jgi:hypothetical protein
MRIRRSFSRSLCAALVLAAGCSSSSSVMMGVGGGGADAGPLGGAGSGGGAGGGSGGFGGGGPTGSAGQGGGAGSGGQGGSDMAMSGDDELIAKLTALTANCTVASNGKYPKDEGSPATVDICKLDGAFFWKSDFDIDCDGQTTTQCNSKTDDSYFDDTSFQQSDGKPLDAAVLPYIVVPLPSNRFDYTKQDIQPGAVAAVIYDGKINFGVFGDEGPAEIIGDIDSGATFIVFTGKAAVVDPIESHQTALDLGHMLAQKLVQP